MKKEVNKMAKNMYQKRKERKNKPVEEKTGTTNINWYPRTYGEGAK